MNPNSLNQPSTSSASSIVDDFEILEKGLTLDKNYKQNIKKLTKNLVKNQYIDPLRMINNQGIITTDKFETLEKIKERKENIKIIEKLDEILELSKFDENKINILILSLENNLGNNNNKKVKLIFNLDNFYLQGFINNQNHYFYFKEEKSLDEWNKEIENLEKHLDNWEELDKKINWLNNKIDELEKNKIIELDKNKEEWKEKLSIKKSKGKLELIKLIHNNEFQNIPEKLWIGGY